MAPWLWLAVGGRVLQGVGAAAAAPASLGLLLAAAGSVRRASTTARWGGTGAVGIALGPVLGGGITTALSWRWAFLVNLPIVAGVLAAAPTYLAESARQPGRRLPDPAGAGLLAGGAALLVLGISQGADWGWLNWRTVAALAVGLLVSLGFVWRSGSVEDPVLDLGLLRERRFALVTLVTIFYSASFFGLLFSFVLFLTGVWHFSLVGAGGGILPMAVIVVGLSTRVGGLSDRVGFRPPLLAGVLLIAFGLLIDAVGLTSQANFLSQWVPAVTLVGLGIGLCYPLLSAAAVDGMPLSELAAATSVNQCARQLGAALGVAAVVAALGAANPAPVHRFHLAWTVGAAFAGLAALAAAALPRRRPAPAVDRAAMELG